VHVELSVSEPHVQRARTPVDIVLDRWAAAVVDAAEPSLIINASEIIVAMSAPVEEMLGIQGQVVIGRGLLDGVLQLLDFGDGGALTDVEIGKIPPLLALTSGRLARGLLRVQCGEEACTLDAIATPLLCDGATVGSLTFFSRV
jgi:hypothetical protein